MGLRLFVGLAGWYLLSSMIGITAAQQAFNVSASNQSPMIIYSPSRSGPANSSWSPSTPGINNTDSSSYNTSRTTSSVGATASIFWFGTAMWWWGELNGSVRMFVDGIETNQAAGQKNVMACVTDLRDEWHNSTLVLLSGTLELWDASFTVISGSNGTVTSNQTLQAVTNGAISNWLDTSQGSWAASNCTIDNGVYEPVLNWTDDSYHYVMTNHTDSKISLDPPKNTSFVKLIGTVGPSRGAFSVALSTASSISGPTPANQSFNGYSPFASEEVVYFASLDPTLLYAITVQNHGTQGQLWDIITATYYTVAPSNTSSQPQPTTTAAQASSSSTNIGAIVGGVVGGVVALIALGLLVWWFLRRRRKAAPVTPPDHTPDPFVVDEDASETRMTPFYDGVTTTGTRTSIQQSAIGTSHDSTSRLPTSMDWSTSNPSSPGLSMGTSSPPSSPGLTLSMAGPSSDRSYSEKMLRPLPLPPGARHAVRSPPPKPPLGDMGEVGMGPLNAESVQEQDAGRVQDVIAPPSYDPSWIAQRD